MTPEDHLKIHLIDTRGPSENLYMSLEDHLKIYVYDHLEMMGIILKCTYVILGDHLKIYVYATVINLMI